MPNPAIVGIGASIGSGLAQSKAAKGAAAAQTQASADQIAEIRRQFDTVRKLLTPWVSAGTDALSQQMALLGLGGQVLGDLPQIETIGGPAKTLPFQRGVGDRVARGGRDGGQGPVPVRTATGQTQYRVNGQLFATFEEAQAFAEANRTRSFDPARARAEQEAAIANLANGGQFQALVRQGEDALLANASATGGLRGGDTQGALAQFRPQMLQALIDRQLANLGGLSANGQNAAAGVGNAAQSAGGQIVGAIGDRGAALAESRLAGGQAIAGTLGDVTGILSTLAGRSGGIPQGAGLFDRWGF